MYKIMTKEEVLQKVNDYCNEKSYTEETLTDGFKDKFAEHFAKRYSEETGIDAEGVEDALKFNLDTVFGATSKWAKDKLANFTEKENEYKNQIAELTKKLGKKETLKFEMPKEVQDQLDELKQFKTEEQKKAKYANVINIAKKGIRTDLHSSFEKFAKTVSVSIDKDDEEQAKEIVQTFQDIFKDSIGDIKPYTPKQVQQREDEIINEVKKITL